MIDIKLTDNGGSSVPPIEPGSYRAICYSIVILGTRHFEKYNKTTNRIRFTWELPDERMDNKGKDMPKAISATYNLSMFERSNLRLMLESWRGKPFTKADLDPKNDGGFSLSKVLGAPCMLATTIATNPNTGKEYAKIVSVTRLPKAMALQGGAENPLVMFDITNPDCPLEDMELLPEFVQNDIKESVEYKERTTSEDDFIVANDEDLPFD